MNCGDFRYLIQRRFDVELSPADDRALLIHLETCESCQKFYHQVQQVIIAAEELEISEDILPQSPESLLNSILENIPTDNTGMKAAVMSFLSRLGIMRGKQEPGKSEALSGITESAVLRRLPKSPTPVMNESPVGITEPVHPPLMNWGPPTQAPKFDAPRKEQEIVAQSTVPEEQIITRSLRDKFGVSGANSSLASSQPLTLAESIRQKISEMSKTGGDYLNVEAPVESSVSEPLDEWSVPHSPEWPKLTIDAPPEEWPSEPAGAKAPSTWGSALPRWSGNEQPLNSPVHESSEPLSSEANSISQASSIQTPDITIPKAPLTSEPAFNKQFGWSAEAEQLETGTWQTVQFDTTLGATNSSYSPPTPSLPDRAVTSASASHYSSESATSSSQPTPSGSSDLSTTIHPIKETGVANNDIQNFIPSTSTGPKIYPVISRRARSTASFNNLNPGASAEPPFLAPAESPTPVEVSIQQPAVAQPEAPLQQPNTFANLLVPEAPAQQPMSFVSPDKLKAPLEQPTTFANLFEPEVPAQQSTAFMAEPEVPAQYPMPFISSDQLETPLQQPTTFANLFEPEMPAQKSAEFIAEPEAPKESPLEFLIANKPKTSLPFPTPIPSATTGVEEVQPLFQFDDGAIDKLFSNNLGVHERSVSAHSASAALSAPVPSPAPVATTAPAPTSAPPAPPPQMPIEESIPSTALPSVTTSSLTTPTYPSVQSPAPPVMTEGSQAKASGLFVVDDNMIDRIFTDHLGVPEQVSKNAVNHEVAPAFLPAPSLGYEMPVSSIVQPTSPAPESPYPPPHTPAPKPKVEVVQETPKFGSSSGYASGKQKVAGVGRLDNRTEAASDPGSGRIASIGKFLLDNKDLEKIGKITASDLSDGKMRTLTVEANEELKNLLKQIDAQQGVLGTLVVGHDGLLIAHTMSQDADAETLGVEAFAVYMGTVQVVEKLGDDNVRQIVSQTNQGYLIIANFGAGLLVTLTTPIMLDNLLPLMRTITQLVAA